MRERSSIAVAVMVLGLVVLACKSRGHGAEPSPSASATTSAPPAKPWEQQAQAAWPAATVDHIDTDAGERFTRIHIIYKTAPKPSEIAERVRAVLVIDAPDRPCAFSIAAGDGVHKGDAAADGIYFIGHVKIDRGIAYGALDAHEIAKRLVERQETAQDALACDVPTWMIVNTPGHFLHNWREYVTRDALLERVGWLVEKRARGGEDLRGRGQPRPLSRRDVPRHERGDR